MKWLAVSNTLHRYNHFLHKKENRAERRGRLDDVTPHFRSCTSRCLAPAMVLKDLTKDRAMEEVCLPYSLRQLVLGIAQQQPDGWRQCAFPCLPGNFALSWAIQVFDNSR